MSGVKATNTRILVGGYLLSGQTNSVQINVRGEQIDVTPFEATGKEYVVLPPEPSVALSGYMTYSADNAATFEARLRSAMTTPEAVGVVLYDTSPAGGRAYVLPGAYTGDMQLKAQTGGVLTVSGTYTSSRALLRGVCVYSALVSATGAQPAIDIGAAGAAGGVAYLFVTAENGAGNNASFTLQAATTSGGTYTTISTFTVSAVGVQTNTLSGTVNRWLRLNCSSLGGATSWHVTLIACVAGIHY